MAVNNVLSSEKITPRVVVRDMKWRTDNGYTLPQGLKQWLRSNNLKPRGASLLGRQDSVKLTWLKRQIASGHPVILLGKIAGTEILHYVTLLGYNQNLFYIYDSYQKPGKPGYTSDPNRQLPGNRSWSSEELLEFWNGGGVWLFYKNYAISVSG